MAGTYALPPGYSMLNGTSMASPQAAGAAALLISAAKQTGVQKQPDQLRQALTSSARLLDTSRIGVYEQGNGLINVGAAWDLLKTNIKTVDITSSVPVNTVDHAASSRRRTSVAASTTARASPLGQSYTRTYTFTRTSGGGGTARTTSRGSATTAPSRSAGSIALAKGVPTTLAVTVNPASGRRALGDPQPRRPVDGRASTTRR